MANKKLYTIEEDIDLNQFEIETLPDNPDLSVLDGDDYVFLTVDELQEMIGKYLSETSNEHAREIYALTHDLKVPLASVKGYTDVILSGMAGELTEQQQKFLETMKSNAEEMHIIIDDMRDTARFDIGPMPIDKSPFQVKTMIAETLQPFERLLADKEQIIDTSIPDDLPLALGDETRFIQVLTNVVSNAHKYTPDKGKVEIIATQNKDFIQISVTDSGNGFSDSEIALLFKRYTHGKIVGNDPMLSIGLSITKNVVEKMDGEIWAESELGKGSTFHFTIPIAKEDTPDD